MRKAASYSTKGESLVQAPERSAAAIMARPPSITAAFQARLGVGGGTLQAAQALDEWCVSRHDTCRRRRWRIRVRIRWTTRALACCKAQTACHLFFYGSSGCGWCIMWDAAAPDRPIGAGPSQMTSLCPGKALVPPAVWTPDGGVPMQMCIQLS